VYNSSDTFEEIVFTERFLLLDISLHTAVCEEIDVGYWSFRKSVAFGHRHRED
jgi:hypothetical protein